MNHFSKKKVKSFWGRKMGEHIPVLLNEAIEGLNINPSGAYVDLTLGRGGHSSEILKRLTDGKLYCFDKDSEAIEESKAKLSSISNHFVIFHNDFRNLKEVLTAANVKKVDGILADLGVSSPQFDEDERGFSYKGSAVLDMRMDKRQEKTAAYVVNNYSLNELVRIFKDYGEEKYAYSIAKNIVAHRPLNSTDELVDIIKKAKPMKELTKKGHPAKQVFQALRIEVNDELKALEEMLYQALDILNINGRLVIITFHSLEDRIVKNVFKDVSTLKGSRINVYALPNEEDEPKYRLINRKIILPSEEELLRNHRSKSAKMRIIERVRI